MKRLILFLAFFPLALFGQRDTVITSDLGFVVDTSNLQISGGDTTVRVVYLNQNSNRKNEILYYEQSPSAKATMAAVYDELLNSLPQLSADVEAAFLEFKKKNTALINRRREYEQILAIMEGYFGY